MDKIGIVVFNNEVSPRFGMSPALMVAQVEGKTVKQSETASLEAVPPGALADFIAGQGVKVLICGGIHERFQTALEQRGVKVIWGIIGPAEQALNEYLAGALKPDRFLCPRRQRRRRKHGRSMH